MRDVIIKNTMLLLQATDKKEIENLKITIIQNINDCSLIIDDKITKELFINSVHNCYLFPNSDVDLTATLRVFGIMIKE